MWAFTQNASLSAAQIGASAAGVEAAAPGALPQPKLGVASAPEEDHGELHRLAGETRMAAADLIGLGCAGYWPIVTCWSACRQRPSRRVVIRPIMIPIRWWRCASLPNGRMFLPLATELNGERDGQ